MCWLCFEVLSLEGWLEISVPFVGSVLKRSLLKGGKRTSWKCYAMLALQPAPALNAFFEKFDHASVNMHWPTSILPSDKDNTAF